MSRAARVHAPDHVFHVISRCMNREFLIDGPMERGRYLSLLERGLSHSDAKVLAWCIMSNHGLCAAAHNPCFHMSEMKGITR